MDTIHTLSLPMQMLDAPYISRVLDYTKKGLIASPCGWGKTLAIGGYIAKKHTDGVLFVAERTEQLYDMRKLLIETHGVDPVLVGLYVSGSEDLEALVQDGTTKTIALVTQARVMSQPATDYAFFHGQKRKLMIIDESLPPLLLLKIPKMFVGGFVTQMNLTWSDLGKLSLDEIDIRLSKLEPILKNHARLKFQKVGIRYLDWTNALPEHSETGQTIRQHAYYLMLQQILLGRFMCSDLDVSILLPMAPHLCWQDAFEHVLVLDATAPLTNYLYQDYDMLTPGTWNYTDIEACIGLVLDIGTVTKVTKTRIKQYPEIFLKQLDGILPSLKDNSGFDDPYVVTYKSIDEKGEESLPNLITERYGFSSQHYGNTRGSNEYREKSSVILLGSYRTPVEFDTLAHILYPSFDPYRQAAATWIQEVYRSRIRNYRGEKIQLAVLGEMQVIKQLCQVINRHFDAFATSAADNLEGYERFLQGRKRQTQRLLYEALKKSRQVHVQEFAKVHTNYDKEKVWRALDSLRTEFPAWADQLIGRRGDECIFLTEKKPFE